MNDNVVHLAFRNDKIEPDVRDLLACKGCRNKTFTIVYQGAEAFPLVQCPACGCHLGCIGWATHTGTDLPGSG